MTEKVCFQIEGEFITDLARTWFWDENKDYDVCENLLLQCLVCDQLTEDDMKAIALQILEGRKKLVGVNEFTLEDDGENIRPVHLKIKEQFRKIKISELKNLMATRMIDFIDPYCTVKSLKAARTSDTYPVINYEQCMTWFWYRDNAIDHTYMRPIEPGDGMLIDEEDDTDLGLWLYNYPDVLYDAMKMHDTYPTKRFEAETFWRDVYNIIKNDFRFRSKYFQNRNERYLASLRVKKNVIEEDTAPSISYKEHDEKLQKQVDKMLEFTNEWIKNNGQKSKTDNAAFELKRHEINMIDSILRDDTYSSRHNRMYLVLPDEYDEWEGLISPNGDFYSCDFGGHNAKAYFLMSVYPEKFPNIDYENGFNHVNCTNALDELLEHGWCATRYLPIRGAYIQMPANGRVTKAQKDAIFDAKVKHDISVDLSPIGY